MWHITIKYSLLGLILIKLLFISSIEAFECGVRKVNINKAIDRGQPTSPGDWPWHVAIHHREHSSDSYVCGGNLISEIFVLTADHCVRDDSDSVLSNRNIFVKLGLYNLRHINWRNFQQHNVNRIHRYKPSDRLRNDIAILELSTEVEFTDYVQPVCLNEVADLTNRFGTAVGWGVDESDEKSPVLKGQRMPVVSTNQCLESNDGLFRAVLDSSIICGGYLNGTTVCNGDSGGGLHFERNGAWYVGGIVSFTAPRLNSLQCHLKSYAEFTNVHHFLPWIRNVTGLGFAANEKTENNDLLPTDCGRYLVNRIVRGRNADLFEFPWIARLISKDKTSGELIRGCHGSLINKRYILTTASCALHEKYEPVLIELGDYDKSKRIDCNVNDAQDCAPPVRTYGIDSAVAHPQFDPFTRHNNIALIRLDLNVKFEDHIQPICIPVTEFLRQQRLQQYVIAGWGAVSDNQGYPNVLQKEFVHVMHQSECKNRTRFYTGDDVICTGGNATPNACVLDDGAPLGYPFRDDDRFYFFQFGITSVFGCEEDPSIYTLVANYMDWILDNLNP